MTLTPYTGDHERYRWGIVYLRGRSTFNRWTDFTPADEVGYGYRYEQQAMVVASDTKADALLIVRDMVHPDPVALVHIWKMNEGEELNLEPNDLSFLTRKARRALKGETT